MFMPSGVAAASATGRYNLLAGTDATNFGYSNGNVIGAIGTLTPVSYTHLTLPTTPYV